MIRRYLFMLIFSYFIATENLCSYKLADFYSQDKALEEDVESYFAHLPTKERVGQLFTTALGVNADSLKTTLQVLEKHRIGGVIFLGRSTDATIRSQIASLNKAASDLGCPPPLFSIDGEPIFLASRLGQKYEVFKHIPCGNATQAHELGQAVGTVLKKTGIHLNFAPVVDVAHNETVAKRSFGLDPSHVQACSAAFTQGLHSQGVVACAKHFPGHGLVTNGDSHFKLVSIDGELKEVENYLPLIKDGVITIMVGHIGIENNPSWNTNGVPASCSRRIITGLLKDEMKFEGIIVTDSMYMRATWHVEDACLEALRAGCDMIIRPIDVGRAISTTLEALENDEALCKQAWASVKKILRLKFCLGLLNAQTHEIAQLQSEE